MKRYKGLLVFVLMFASILFLAPAYAEAATVGQQLTQPESGWTRIDNSNTKLTYLGTWNLRTADRNFYNGDHKSTLSLNDEIRFNFTGSSLRILTTRDCYNHIGGSADVYIDGNKVGHYENKYTSTVIPLTLLYENTELSDSEHSARIVVTSTLGDWGFDFDCIDIKGEIKDYGTKQDNIIKTALEVGETKQLSVSDELSDNTNLTWVSSNPAVATVDANNKVKALKPGDTVITCTSADGEYTDKINVLVVNLNYQLAVDLLVGEKCRLTVDDLKDTAKVTWTVNDPSIATVSNKGRVTAVSEGLTFVTATDEAGKIIGQIYIRVRQ